MSEPKVAPEVAEEEVRRWADALDASLDIGARDTLVRAVVAGRLRFEVQTETFSYTLRRPVKLDNGEVISALTVAEPNGRQVLDASRAKDQIDQSLRLLAAVSGQPLGVIERIGQKDLLAAGAVMGFFG